MSGDQLRPLKQLEKETEQLHRAVFGLTLDTNSGGDGLENLLTPYHRSACVEHFRGRIEN